MIFFRESVFSYAGLRENKPASRKTYIYFSVKVFFVCRFARKQACKSQNLHIKSMKNPFPYVGLVKEWINNGCDLTPVEMAKILELGPTYYKRERGATFLIGSRS